MIVIYGKPEGCPQCDVAKLACEMKGVPHEYKLIGVDATPDELTLLAGVPIRSAPVIFERDNERDNNGKMKLIGGYRELRHRLTERPM